MSDMGTPRPNIASDLTPPSGNGHPPANAHARGLVSFMLELRARGKFNVCQRPIEMETRASSETRSVSVNEVEVETSDDHDNDARYSLLDIANYISLGTYIPWWC